MAIRTWVGRFCVADGRVQEEGPWLGSLIRQRPDEEADELYVLVEPAGAASEAYTSQLVDVIAQLYSKDPLSLTGALTRSLRAAHEHLRDWNRKSLREHRVGAGASCIALRGREAYLAQIGPSLAYIRTADGGFRRIESDDASFEASLGVADEFTPRLKRIELNPGDLVLLASTKLEAIAPADHIERLLARDPDDALPELFMLCRDEANAAIVMLSCFEAAEPPPEFLTRAGDARLASPPAPDNDPAIGQAVLAGAPAGDAPLRAEASLALSAGSFNLPSRPAHEQVAEITASNAPGAPTGVRLRGGDATPRYKGTGGGSIIPQLRVPKLALFAAAALAMLGLLIWWQLPGSVQQSREDKFIALIAEARESNARAQATGEPALRRQLLTDAESTLADAEKIHGDSGELLALKADIASAIGVLNAVYEVREFTPVSDIAQQVTGSLSITQTVIGGGNAYLLDAGDRRVLRIPLDGSAAPETILQDGDTNFVTPSRPVSIAWSEDAGSLLIIDENRQAFAYTPGAESAPLVVRGADGWGSLDAVAASSGNLYVLDVAGNQVWRYLPGQSGFDSERAALLEAAILDDATELVVAQDIYMLDRALGIRRFEGKTEIPFPLAGIDRPLMEPAALSVLPGSGRLVVADRGNKRIIVASAEGAFLRQIISPAFTDLRAVAVDEGAGILYVLNGDTLLRAPFPP